MTTLTPLDILALLARLAFVVVLYIFVLAALLSLRRTLRATSALGSPDAPAAGAVADGPGHAGSAPLTARLALVEAPPVDGPPGRLVPLDRPVVVGRRAECDLVLRDASVSARHARLAWDTEAWEVEDLGSTNGTYVNGQRVEGRASLRDGDRLQIGNTAWRIEVEA